jgi:Mlc titration factor MtfA (ptsG expression regulator)
VVFGFLKRRRRQRLRERPIPKEWQAILKRNVPFFGRLPLEDQMELLGHVHVFLAEKHFEGCGGLEMTDEICITIAAQACLLLLHRDTDYYPRLITILVYPSHYQAYENRHLEGHVWEEGWQDLLGHTARQLRSLVIAWDAVKGDATHPSDGRNVVLHEFAHQLDFEDYTTDGAPVLGTRTQYQKWAKVMIEEFNALRAAAEANTPTLLDTYGATNPAEFFAVSTEAFFERPRALRARHPKLYAEFARFFRQDPVSYSAELALDLPSGHPA